MKAGYFDFQHAIARPLLYKMSWCFELRAKFRERQTFTEGGRVVVCVDKDALPSFALVVGLVSLNLTYPEDKALASSEMNKKSSPFFCLCCWLCLVLAASDDLNSSLWVLGCWFLLPF